MSDMLNVTYGTLTNRGERAVNEDYLDVVITPERLAFILCDGLGGHGNGEIASRLVVEQMKSALEHNASIEEAILYAQQELLEEQRQQNAGDSMKTTVTCLA